MEEKLFDDVCSTDLLGFSFGNRSYKVQLTEAIAKTGVSHMPQFHTTLYCIAELKPLPRHVQGFCGVDVYRKTLSNGLNVVWVQHNFAFLGGSLGCAEGERITRAFEYAKEQKLPIVVQVSWVVTEA